MLLRRMADADVDNPFRLNGDPKVMRYLIGGATPREQIRDEIIPFQLGCCERFGGLDLWAADER